MLKIAFLFGGASVGLALALALTAPTQELSPGSSCLVDPGGSGPMLDGVVIDGRCQPVAAYSHPIGTICVKDCPVISHTPRPQCDDGYEIVLRSEMNWWCAKDFRKPH